MAWIFCNESSYKMNKVLATIDQVEQQTEEIKKDLGIVYFEN